MAVDVGGFVQLEVPKSAIWPTETDNRGGEEQATTAKSRRSLPPLTMASRLAVSRQQEPPRSEQQRPERTRYTRPRLFPKESRSRSRRTRGNIAKYSKSSGCLGRDERKTYLFFERGLNYAIPSPTVCSYTLVEGIPVWGHVVRVPGMYCRGRLLEASPT